MVVISSAFVSPAVAAKKVKIKLGTLAPEGSPWFLGLKRTAQQWATASGGKVELKIYPGGVLGDEGDMIRKLRIDQLQGGSFTGIGLGQITRTTIALQIPMMMRSYEELDYVRSKMGPSLQAELDKAGFVMLGWGDAGWAHFFSKTPAPTVAEQRKLKIFMWAADPDSEAAWRAAQFRPVVMSATDVLSGLQTGLLESFCTTPVYALSSQWFGLAKHMVQVNWTPLNGATIVSKARWESIEPDLRARLLEIALASGEKTREEVRQLDGKAVEAMKARGLVVHVPTAAELVEWQKAAELSYPAIRGKVVSEEAFDRVKKLVTEFRASKVE
ncbi:MAG: TRAP transporter substrate-binding protein DctP [Deltaproteobacteria bacterium]|nr:TRAP transporter substrate-binding protein DctP [Deltaproteobacteria bacterium]